MNEPYVDLKAFLDYFGLTLPADLTVYQYNILWLFSFIAFWLFLALFSWLIFKYIIYPFLKFARTFL